MTASPNITDRRIVLASLVLLVLFTGAALLIAPSEGGSRGFPSSYSTDRDGAKAAYMLLGDLGYRVERWTDSPENLPSSPRGTVLIIAAPLIPGTDEERLGLKQYVAAGGRLLVTGWLGATLVEGKGVDSSPSSLGWENFTAELPSPLTRRASNVTMEVTARWARLHNGQQSFYGSDEGATVVKWRIGDGEVIWWGSDSPLTNFGITKASNLQLFLNCVGPPQSTRVLWDEYFHGTRPGLWHYVAHTPLPWALAQLLLLGIFVVATYSRRSGAMRPLTRPSRLSPLEFVETVGTLYERKGAAAGALEIAFTRFRSLLARRLGMPPGASTSDLMESAKSRSGWASPALLLTMQQIDSAVKAQAVAEPAALAWIRELYDMAHRLGLEG